MGEAEREGAAWGTGALTWQLTDIQMPRPRLVDRQTRDVKATEIFFLIQEFHFSGNSIDSQRATVRSLLASPLKPYYTIDTAAHHFPPTIVMNTCPQCQQRRFSAMLAS